MVRKGGHLSAAHKAKISAALKGNKNARRITLADLSDSSKRNMRIGANNRVSRAFNALEKTESGSGYDGVPAGKAAISRARKHLNQAKANRTRVHTAAEGKKVRN